METQAEANERWRRRLQQFVDEYKLALMDGIITVHVYIRDGERCILLYVERETAMFKEELAILRDVASQEPDAFRYRIKIKVIKQKKQWPLQP